MSGMLEVVGVNALDDASADQITFILDAAHAERWANASAGAALVSHGIEPKGHEPQSRAFAIRFWRTCPMVIQKR